MIEVKRLMKSFGGLHVLDETDFRVNEGSFVSIIGPSGCGKTTLLKMVGGLIEPTSGKVTVSGKHTSEALKERSFGFVFQNPALLRWRTVRENIALPLEIIGRPIDKERIRKLIETVGLDGFDDYYPDQLSGGMQQRTALARALVFDPPILLMDEPFGALDEMTRNRMNGELMRIWNTGGMGSSTVLFVTHSISEAVFLSDKVLVMSERPAKIRKTVDIDIPRPRRRSTKSSKRYLELVDELRDLLGGESCEIG